MVGKLFTQQGREEDTGNCIVADIRDRKAATENSLSSATNSRTMRTHKK